VFRPPPQVESSPRLARKLLQIARPGFRSRSLEQCLPQITSLRVCRTINANSVQWTVRRILYSLPSFEGTPHPSVSPSDCHSITLSVSSACLRPSFPFPIVFLLFPLSAGSMTSKELLCDMEIRSTVEPEWSWLGEIVQDHLDGDLEDQSCQS
jgi:hypothetical protein